MTAETGAHSEPRTRLNVHLLPKRAFAQPPRHPGPASNAEGFAWRKPGLRMGTPDIRKSTNPSRQFGHGEPLEPHISRQSQRSHARPGREAARREGGGSARGRRVRPNTQLASDTDRTRGVPQRAPAACPFEITCGSTSSCGLDPPKREASPHEGVSPHVVVSARPEPALAAGEGTSRHGLNQPSRPGRRTTAPGPRVRTRRGRASRTRPAGCSGSRGRSDRRGRSPTPRRARTTRRNRRS